MVKKWRDPVAQLRADIAGVVGKGFRRFGRLPAADAVLQRLRQIPVIERRVRLDAVGEQLVDQAVVEREPLGVGWPVPCGKMRGQEIENR